MTEQPCSSPGEAVDVLGHVFRAMNVTKRRDGMVHVQLRADDATMAPFARALLRVEAELLLADADALTPENLNAVRTAPQRSADALVELARRMGERTKRQPDR